MATALRGGARSGCPEGVGGTLGLHLIRTLAFRRTCGSTLLAALGSPRCEGLLSKSPPPIANSEAVVLPQGEAVTQSRRALRPVAHGRAPSRNDAKAVGAAPA